DVNALALEPDIVFVDIEHVIDVADVCDARADGPFVGAGVGDGKRENCQYGCHERSHHSMLRCACFVDHPARSADLQVRPSGLPLDRTSPTDYITVIKHHGLSWCDRNLRFVERERGPIIAKCAHRCRRWPMTMTDLCRHRSPVYGRLENPVPPRRGERRL